MTAEAGKDEFPGLGIPVEVDGHAGTRVEAMAERDMQGEEAAHPLVCGRVVGSMAYLGVLAEIAPEVAEPSLRRQEFIQLNVVGGISLELGEGDETGEVAV